jgi:hypothetical protein
MSSRATPQSKPRCPFRHPATFTKFAKRRCQILRWSTDGVSSLTHPVQRPFISTRRNSLGITRTHGEEDVMERRHFLKLTFGFAAGAAALAASARAAPLMPHPLAEDGPPSPSNEDARPAVTNGDEVEHLKLEEVRGHGGGHGRGGHRGWGRGRHRGWGRRHWGWRRRHWGWRRRRHWGWRRRHWGWRRRHWRRRYWRRRYY